eukprot:gene54501-50757_t
MLYTTDLAELPMLEIVRRLVADGDQRIDADYSTQSEFELRSLWREMPKPPALKQEVRAEKERLCRERWGDEWK